MNQTLTIAKRELTSLFFLPIAYVVLGIFAGGTALIFLKDFGPGEAATLRPTFKAVIWVMIFLVPAISMRLISEEFRSGSIEPLMTSPVTDAQVIVGKWLGAMGFFAVLLSPLVVLTAVLEATASPDYGPIFTGFLGLALVGGFYLAIGIFASAITQNQIIAFLLTVFIICVFTLVMYFLPQAAFLDTWAAVTNKWGIDLRQVMFYVNVDLQYEDFSKGLIDISNLIFFASGIALFLFFAVKVLESRRWR